MTLVDAEAALVRCGGPIAAGEDTAITPRQTGGMRCALARHCVTQRIEK